MTALFVPEMASGHEEISSTELTCLHSWMVVTVTDAEIMQ